MSAGLDYHRRDPIPEAIKWRQETRTRPDLCPEFGHPGVTYNERMDLTWCLCGAEIYEGNAVETPHLACCGGPLTSPVEAS